MAKQAITSVLISLISLGVVRSQSISTGIRTCAVLNGREVKCWGSLLEQDTNGLTGISIGNDAGEMGINIPPIDLGSIAEPQHVVTNGATTCVLFTNQGIKCWGQGDFGILGYGDGSEVGIAFDNNAQMGDNLPFVDLGSDFGAKQISMGANHACAVSSTGGLKCWGDNGSGQLGLEDSNNRGLSDGHMGDNLPYVDLGLGVTAKSVTCGSDHTCAILASDDIKCWGRNDNGQLGLGTTSAPGADIDSMGNNLPGVDLGQGIKAIKVVAGSLHTCAIVTGNLVKCWGYNNVGTLGYGDTIQRGRAAGEMGDDLPFVDLGPGETVTDLTAAAHSNCAVISEGLVKCWGWGFRGVLGQGSTDSIGDLPGSMGSNLTTVELGSPREVHQIAAGEYTVCVSFETDFNLKCWGNNLAGQLGQGDNVIRGDTPGEMGSSLNFVDLGSGRTIFDGATLAPTLEPTPLPTASPTKEPTGDPTAEPTAPTTAPTTAAPTPTPDRTELIIGITAGSIALVAISCVLCAYFSPTVV